MLIVTNALADTPDGLKLHPLLFPLQKDLSGRARTWFRASMHTPLSLFAWMVDRLPASLIASRIALSGEMQQCWVASPFHARLMRDHLQVMPEGLFAWRGEDAARLAGLLNPFLESEGMHLYVEGAALLLACREPLDAVPTPFAGITGGLLPNRHPEGTDGGRLMRLIAEIQMFLHNHRDRLQGAADVSGLWLWGGVDVPSVKPAELPPVATRNAFLAAVTEGRGAKLTVTDAEQLDELLNPATPLPHDVLLFGDGHALWLTPSSATSLITKLRRKASLPLRPERVKEEAALLQRIREGL